MLLVAIAVAGAIGALARWGLSNLMVQWWGPRLPLGTLCVNLLGCFLLGILSEVAERSHLLSAEVRVAIAVGFIGTLTTFSTWEYESWHMARRGEVLWAAGNLAVNVVFGFLLLWGGSRLVAQAWR